MPGAGAAGLAQAAGRSRRRRASIRHPPRIPQSDPPGKGFPTIRKAGKLPVKVESASLANPAGRAQDLEISSFGIR